MDSQLLDTPDGIAARLGWDPATSDHDRIRMLARQLVAARVGARERDVVITREAPTTFGHHTLLIASVDEEEVPLTIKTTTHRAASVVAVADRGIRFGIDVSDRHPDETTMRDIRRHSHLVDGTTDEQFVDHWTHVQAVLRADARGNRVPPESVRLDSARRRGWVLDRPIHYDLRDLSRGGFVITLAWALAGAE